MTARIVHRPARSTSRLEPAPERVVEPPPSNPEGERAGGARGLMTLLPMLGAGASMTTMLMYRGSQYAVLGALLMVLVVLGSAVMLLSQRGRASAKRQQGRDRYLAYLERERAELHDVEAERSTAARAADPHADALLSVVRDPARLWERRREDGDFLQTRLGTGEVPATTFTRRSADNPMVVPDDFMSAELGRVERRFATVTDLPVVVDLNSAGDVSIVGDREFVDRVVRLLVCQATAFSSPEDVRLALVADKHRVGRWAWLRWLPHLADQSRTAPTGPMRRVMADTAELAAILRADLHERLSAAAELRRNFLSTEGGGRLARMLVVVDNHGRMATPIPLGDKGIGPANIGLTVLHQVATREAEPDDVNLRISQAVPGSGDAVIERYERRDAQPERREATLDEFGEPSAEALARTLAGLRLSPDSLEHDSSQQSLAAAELLDIPDIEHFDPQTAWAPRPRTSFLRVPLGLDDNGQPVVLDLKEAAQFGMGPHGLCVGATGSGKSELLRTLVLGLMTTHSPADVNMVLVDYKGGATFAPFANAPQVSGVITNLSDDAGLIERVYASLAGEVQRRQQLLKDAGNLSDITAYRRARAERPGELEPLPHLLVIIDEFGELLTARPDFIELFLSIGRIGRSIGVHLLLSSQRIEGGKLRGLETYLSYRIGLRTLSDSESRTVLDTPDAFALPPLPGFGYLKVDTTTYTRFRAAYVSGPLPDDEEDSPSDAPAEIVPVPVYAAESLAETTAEGAATEDDEEEETGPTVLGTVMRQLAEQPRASAPVWLPPLPRRLALDDIAGAPHATRSGLRIRRAGFLQVPMGRVDDPAKQTQGPWHLDLAAAGGNVLVIGAPRSGRTTVLRTLATSLALTHGPDEVVVFALDLLSSNLMELDGLPNVGGVGVRMDHEVVRRTVEEVSAMLAHRETLLMQLGAHSMADARAAAARGDERAGDALLADVVLMIDGYGQIADEFEDLEDTVTELVRRGGAYGIHVVATASRWNEVRLNQQTFFGTRIELRLGDPTESSVDRKLSETLKADAPGRALLSSKLFVQLAMPRTDGCADETTDGFAELTEQLRKHADLRAPRVRLLPPVVRPADLSAPERAGQVPIGLDETDLSTAMLDTRGADESLLVLGDNGTGRTSLLRHIATTLVGQSSPDEVVIAVFDPRRVLHGVVPKEYLGGYAGSPALAERLAAGVAKELAERVPDTVEGEESDSAALGPRIVVLVDDYDALTAGGSSPLSPLLPFIPMSRELRLHVVLARRMSGASRAMYEQVFMAVRESGATGLMLSGDKAEGQLLGSVRPRSMPPGRATLIRTGAALHTVQLVLPEEPDDLEGVGFSG